MDPRAEKPFEARLADLDIRIQRDLEEEAVGYDRGRVLQPEYTEILELNKDTRKAVLGLPSLAAITQSYKEGDAKGVKGTCRDIAPFTTWKYVEDGLLDEAETYSCAEKGEFHYVTIGKIGEKEVICDLGYNIPLRTAIPVHTTPQALGKGWIPSEIMLDGKMVNVVCRAEREGDRVTLDVWDVANTYIRHFDFKKVDNNRDKETAKGWIGVTGKAYRMDSQGRKASLPEGAAPLADQFMTAHEIATSTGGQVEILLRDKMGREKA